MKYLNFVFLSFSLHLSPLLAKTYTVNAAGDRWIVAPASFQLRLQPWNQEPKPNCTELFRTLEGLSNTINRCLPGVTPQPTTACGLLKTSLPLAIFGANNPSGPVAEDVEQYFEVDQTDFDPIPDLGAVATAERLPVASLVLATQSPWPSAMKQQEVKIVGGTESYLPRLVQLDYLKNFVGQIAIGTSGAYGVRDRVSYCELSGGQSHLQGKVSYKTGVKFALSAPALEWTYKLYLHLTALTYPLPGSFEQQALAIGYEIGLFSIENPLSQENSAPAVDDLYRAFYEKNKTVLQLKTFTKAQLQQNFSKAFEAEVSANFKSHN